MKRLQKPYYTFIIICKFYVCWFFMPSKLSFDAPRVSYSIHKIVRNGSKLQNSNLLGIMPWETAKWLHIFWFVPAINWSQKSLFLCLTFRKSKSSQSLFGLMSESIYIYFQWWTQLCEVSGAESDHRKGCSGFFCYAQ